MLRNNLSIAKLLGIIISSPALLGIGLIFFNELHEDIINDKDDLVIFIITLAFPLIFLVSGIGLYLHKSWGRVIATLCTIVIMIALIIMMLAVAPRGGKDLPLLIGIVGSGLIFCSGLLLLLYNYRVTKELRNDTDDELNNEILDSNYH